MDKIIQEGLNHQAYAATAAGTHPVAYVSLHEQLDEIAGLMIRAGTILLSSGSEVYRVESLMDRIGDSFPVVDSCTAYVTLTGIMVTVTGGEQSATKICRIRSIGNNLAKIKSINHLAHDLSLHPVSAAELSKMLDEVEKIPEYKDWQNAIYAALGSAGFGIFFQLSWIDVLFTFVCALLTQIAGLILQHFTFNNFLKILLQSFLAGACVRLIVLLRPVCQEGTMLLSVLMLLVPGMTLTNALRDTLTGNYLSGLSRLTVAMLTGISIAIGTGIALTMGR